MKTCPHCAGHGFDLDDRDWSPVPCPVCHNAGTVPGLDPALVHEVGRLTGRLLGWILRGVLTAVLALALGCPWTAAVVLAGLALALSLR
jgi:hypothetical protein